MATITRMATDQRETPFWKDRHWWREWAKSAFGRDLYGFVAFALIAAGLVWYTLGPTVFLEAVDDDIGMLIDTLPRVLVAISVAALLWVLLPRDRLAGMLGRESGLKGLVIATFAGTITPGGPSSAYALLAMLGASGADRGTMIAYIAAWATLGLQRILIWDVPFMGEEFSILRFAVTVPLPIIAGMIARAIPMELRLRDPGEGGRDAGGKAP